MAKTKQTISAKEVEEIVARALETGMAARPTSPKFFSAKSVGMWSALGTLIVAGIAIFGSINGCFSEKFTKEQKLNAAYDGFVKLDSGDIALQKIINRNYWTLYTLMRSQDSIASERHDETLDSIYALRVAINQKKNK